MSEDQVKKSGYVALVGKPNVGKSTLMNDILGMKLSITSKKPQTTRHRILGVKTELDTQVVYVDTPGLHRDNKKTINRVMNRAARSALHDVDIILFLIEALRFEEQDAWVLKQLKELSVPVILVVNKIDRVKDKSALLPFIEKLSAECTFKMIIPICAKSGLQVDHLESEVIKLLPEENAFYPPEQFTDRSDRFIASEFVREKLMRLLGDEIPYDIAVTIDAFEEDEKIIRIAAVIWVAKASQKPIVIGKKGELLKRVGTEARQDLESYYDKQVFVKLWVKVKTGWSDDKRAVLDFGYDEG